MQMVSLGPKEAIMLMNGMVQHSPDGGKGKYQILEGQKAMRTGSQEMINEFQGLFGKVKGFISCCTVCCCCCPCSNLYTHSKKSA